jgi:hypothetical protein
MRKIVIAAALLAGVSPAFALGQQHSDPLKVREAWYQAYFKLNADPTTFKQHDCFNAEKTYCQDTMANQNILTPDKKRYMGLLAVEFKGETIRKLCVVSLDSTNRYCMNDKDGTGEFQVWDSAAAGWQNAGEGQGE